MFGRYRFMQKMERLCANDMENLRQEYLSRLLLQAYHHVPYYRRVLAQAQVVTEQGVALENWSRIPILTKEIIRREGKQLYSQEASGRHRYTNTSGGSTGEPVTFVQDWTYEDWLLGCRFYYNKMAGKEPGQRELKLWGSERDVFDQAEKVATRLRRWLFNMKLLNSFVMSEETMERYVAIWSQWRPTYVWSYTYSLYELGRYLRRRSLNIHAPQAIICTAETLTDEMREEMEKIFGCCVLNQYGSREVGVIACECPRKEGLHVFTLNNHVELLDPELHPCSPGQMGEVIVTNLHNDSMPLIRYRIGDTAVAAGEQQCSCGRTWPLMQTVTGRISDHFRTRDGKLIHGEYFTHLFYGLSNVIRFQVVQEDYERVRVFIVAGGEFGSPDQAEVEEKIKLVLGAGCEVVFEFVEDLAPSASGKYRYTISRLD